MLILLPPSMRTLFRVYPCIWGLITNTNAPELSTLGGQSAQLQVIAWSDQLSRHGSICSVVANIKFVWHMSYTTIMAAGEDMEQPVVIGWLGVLPISGWDGVGLMSRSGSLTLLVVGDSTI